MRWQNELASNIILMNVILIGYDENNYSNCLL
jgi:hypothetical protein